jgi:inorganic pyrophosphatase
MPVQHPWHELSPGRQLPEIVNAVVEIPKGSRTKYEIDKPSGLLRVDRLLPASMMYPMHYGFIPQTMGKDGDPLDIMVVTAADVQALSVMEVRVIGIMHMLDQGVPDEKLIGVFTGDFSVREIRSFADLPQHFFDELRAFFNGYKELEGKKVLVQEFQDVAHATASLHEAVERYRAAYPKAAQ